MTRVVPSILAADFTRLGEQVLAVEAAGVDRFQVDVMDGRFVPNITFGTQAIEGLRAVLDGPPRELPAQRVRPQGGSLSWFLDEAAARKLSPATRGER